MSRPPAPMPPYVALARSGELAQRHEQARALLAECRLCPRRCKAKRAQGTVGACGASSVMRIAYHGLHHGEEPPISGVRGAGTVFFSHCNLRCVYCQNYQISHLGEGRDRTPEQLAAILLDLQDKGAHNIDLVTPTHYLPEMLEAVASAALAGLRLPLVYNTSGYELAETLDLLDGVVDIYLADMRYGRPGEAARLSEAPDYVEVNREAVRTMWRQVGPLATGPDGLARRGLLIRHLVLPGDLSGAEEVFRFIAEELDPSVPVSVMSQYQPAHHAAGVPPLDRPLSQSEYRAALRALRRHGLSHAFVQRLSSAATGSPDFSRDEPFEWDETASR